jgi:hypothetical protein
MLCPVRLFLFKKYWETLGSYNLDVAALRESLYVKPRVEFDAIMEAAKYSCDRRDEARHALKLHVLFHQCGRMNEDLAFVILNGRDGDYRT